MIYLSLLLILSTFIFLELTIENKNKKFIMIGFITILLIYFSGFRHQVGADDLNYAILFNQVKTIMNESIINSYTNYFMEPGFVALNSTIKVFTNDYHLFMLFIAFLTVLFTSYNYSRYSPYVILSLLLYFVHTFLARDMNQIRAGLAASILLFSIKYIYNNNFIKFSLVILIASSFHIGAIVFFITYFVARKEYNKFTYLSFIFIAIILSYFGLAGIVVENLPDSLGILKTVLTGYYNSPEFKNSVSTFDITNIKQIAISLTIILCLSRLKEKSIYFILLFNIYIIGVIWRIAFSDFGIFAARFATFLTITEVILITFFLLCVKGKQKIFIAFLIVLYAFATLYLNIFIKKDKPVTEEYKNYIIEEMR